MQQDVLGSTVAEAAVQSRIDSFLQQVEGRAMVVSKASLAAARVGSVQRGDAASGFPSDSGVLSVGEFRNEHFPADCCYFAA